MIAVPAFPHATTCRQVKFDHTKLTPAPARVMPVMSSPLRLVFVHDMSAGWPTPDPKSLGKCPTSNSERSGKRERYREIERDVERSREI